MRCFLRQGSVKLGIQIQDKDNEQPFLALNQTCWTDSLFSDKKGDVCSHAPRTNKREQQTNAIKQHQQQKQQTAKQQSTPLAETNTQPTPRTQHTTIQNNNICFPMFLPPRTRATHHAFPGSAQIKPQFLGLKWLPFVWLSLSKVDNTTQMDTWTLKLPLTHELVPQNYGW